MLPSTRCRCFANKVALKLSLLSSLSSWPHPPSLPYPPLPRSLSPQLFSAQGRNTSSAPPVDAVVSDHPRRIGSAERCARASSTFSPKLASREAAVRRESSSSSSSPRGPRRPFAATSSLVRPHRALQSLHGEHARLSALSPLSLAHCIAVGRRRCHRVRAPCPVRHPHGILCSRGRYFQRNKNKIKGAKCKMNFGK